MIVYIGNVKNNEWYTLTKEPIQPKLSNVWKWELRMEYNKVIKV